MNEITVAKPDTSTIVVAAAITVAVLGSAIPYGGWAIRFGAVLLGWAAVRRFAQMRLAVTRSAVVVQNYTARHELPLDEVKIIDEREDASWVSEMGGKGDEAGRSLYVMDDSGRKVHVGVAPAYGSRLDRIAEDLIRAIERMKSAR